MDCFTSLGLSFGLSFNFFGITRGGTKNHGFNIGTFNVRGLNYEFKQQQLSGDIDRYKVDVCCLQETKIKKGLDTMIGKNRLISLPTACKHYGNGFMISARFANHVHSYWKISDRISVLQLTTPESKIKSNATPIYRTLLNGMKLTITKNIPADHMITIINVYAPTTTRVRNNMKELENMYVTLSELINNFKNLSTAIVYLAGDFNAKVGVSTGSESCLGKFSRGRRNNSGETLVNFCDSQGLFICNSAFQHPARHITTWSQHKKDKKTNKMIDIYNQIDYIIINKNQTQCMTDSRSYAGNETFSDHRLVVTRYQLIWPVVYQNNSSSSTKRFNSQKLTDTAVKEVYQKRLNEEMTRRDEDSNWVSLQAMIMSTAEEVVGFKAKAQARRVENEYIKKLSTDQKNIRLQIESTSDIDICKSLKVKRKAIQKEITSELKRHQEKETDRILTEVNNATESSKMFKAIKLLKRKRFENPIIHDDEGKSVANNQEKYNIINQHFKTH